MYEIKCQNQAGERTMEFVDVCPTQSEAAEAVYFMADQMVVLHLLKGFMLIPVSNVTTDTSFRLELQSLCGCVTVVISATEIDTPLLH